MIKIGIVREGKVPHDFRVPLTPKQCKEILDKYKDKIEILVQTSPIRTFKDEEYIQQGIQIVTNLSDCDIIVGVKEVPISELIPNKQYIFFSHTIKEQPHNRKLLQAILEKKISLIDYEAIRGENGKRLIGFGRYAGIVGCYNGFRTYGLKTGKFNLIKAVDTNDRKIIEQELKKVILPNDFKLVVTGYGRVGHGVREILSLLPIREVNKEDFLNKDFQEPIFLHLDTADYYRRSSDQQFDKAEFYATPQKYECHLVEYLKYATMYMSGHFWNENAPIMVSKEALRRELKSLQVIADISCDVAEPIESTLRASTIADPIYGYNKMTGEEDDFRKEDILAVMAVDNLPCELPLDASRDFGNEFMANIIPHLVAENYSPILENARITDTKGFLTKRFQYLKDYVNGNTTIV